MKLKVERDLSTEKKNVIDFIMYFKLELSDEELRMIKEYQMNRLLLTVLIDSNSNKRHEVRVDDLCGGIEIKTQDAFLAFEFEGELAYVCEEFSIHYYKVNGFKKQYFLDLPQNEK